MKRIVHILTGLLLVLILIGIGAGLIHMASSPECWTRCVDVLRAERGWGMLAGLLLLALVGVYFLTVGRTVESSEQFLSFRNNGGTVSILLRAVNEFITKIGDEFAAIVSMKTAVRPHGSSISIDLDIRVKAGTQIPELCQLLQERVRESVKQNLGLSDIKRIRVQVKDIVGDAPLQNDLPDQVEA